MYTKLHPNKLFLIVKYIKIKSKPLKIINFLILFQLFGNMLITFYNNNNHKNIKSILLYFYLIFYILFL